MNSRALIPLMPLLLSCTPIADDEDDGADDSTSGDGDGDGDGDPTGDRR